MNSNTVENGETPSEYDKMALSLLGWIEEKIAILDDRTFANTLPEVQQQLLEFNQYRRQEKPPKYAEKGKLESELYTSRSGCSSPGGRNVLDINLAWGRLEKCEHDREMALRGHLQRLEKLEQLAGTFDKKYSMRESWLMQNRSVVNDENFSSSSIDNVEAAIKKLDALAAYVETHQDKIDNIASMADDLEKGGFHDAERIMLCKGRILRLWGGLQDMIKRKKEKLMRCMQLSILLQGMTDIIDSINETKVVLLSEDYGKDHVEGQNIVEGEITVKAHQVHVLKSKVGRFLNLEDKDDLKVNEELVSHHLSEMERVFNELVHLSAARHIKQDTTQSTTTETS